MTTGARRPGIDLIRGVAVWLVMVRHAWASAFPGGGIVGVTMFFALSGYLITGVLTREAERTGRVSYTRFYVHRALRLLPALVVMLAIFAVVELATDRLGDRALIPSSVLAGLLYLADLPLFTVAPALSHLWSLAVEEQFYLVWPTLLVLALRRRRTGPLLVLGVAGSLAACLVTLSLSNAPIDIYMLPTSWSSALVIGAAAQLHKERLAPLAERGWPFAVLLLTAMCFLPDAKSHSYTYLIGAPLIGVCASALVLKAARWEEIWVWSTPLRWLGLISYAAYLWDFPIINWLRGSEANKLPLWGGPASIVLTIAAATASWYLLERHALRLKDRLNIGRRRGRHAAGIPVIKVPAGVT